MAKRKRTPAPPPVRARREQRKASPRVLIGAAAALVVIAVGIGLGVALGGGSSSKHVTLTGAGQVEALFKGIPQHGNVLGSPSAPVTLAEYVDLQCPYCREFETQALPALLGQFVRTGKVKIEARPIAFIGPDSVRGREAAAAAAQQNRMFDFMELLYFNQGTENTGWLSDATVKAAVAALPGLDVPKLLAARSSAAVKAQEQRFDAQASADAVNQTPTILVGKSGGKLQQVALSSPTDEASVAAAIRKALA